MLFQCGRKFFHLWFKLAVLFYFGGLSVADDVTRHPDSNIPIGNDTTTVPTPSTLDITADFIFGLCSSIVIVGLLIAIFIMLVVAYGPGKKRALLISGNNGERGDELELTKARALGNGERPISTHGYADSTGHSEASYHKYDETSLTDGVPASRGIPLEDYPDYVHRNRQSAEIVDEFSALPRVNEVLQTYAKEEENKPKNRYKNILPYNHTRVVLEKLSDDPYSDYINASYIDSFEREKAYIATQGPKKNTIGDFWRMVWQEKIRVIAMVTGLEEGLKTKCERYWPDVVDIIEEYGGIRVKLLASTEREFGVVRTIELAQDSGDSLEVSHYQFTKWPDKSVPKRTSLFLRYLRTVRQAYRQDVSAPLLVHCSAGIGRTGVVIALDSLYDQAQKTGLVKLHGFVQSMRESRQSMVQTDEQYVFLHEALLEMLLCEDTRIPVEDFSTRFRALRRRNPGSSRSPLDDEFEILSKLCPDPAPRAVRTARLTVCDDKNRDPSVVPIERNRVMLQTRKSLEPGGDYINATHIIADENRRFIVAQMPLPETLDDLWALVYDYKPDIIVMMNELDKTDPLCVQYWPDDGSMECGPFTVSTTLTEKETGLILRTIQVQLTGTQNVRVVRHYQFLGWPGDNVLLNDQSKSLLAKLVRTIYPSKLILSEPRVLIHCMDGAGRSGVFCTLKMALDQIVEEGAVDIFQIVKSLRIERMRMVPTEADYRLCYEAIDEYINGGDYGTSTHTYQNHFFKEED